MPSIRILSETELRQAIPLDLAAVNCVAEGFAALGGGTVEMPPILSMGIRENNGEVDVKTAHITGAESFTIKMSPGFYDNPAIGLPTTNGIMVVFSAKTGQVEALLLDNGYLTEVRTAAAGAVAARALAREDAATACIVGAGMQARLQLKALCLVRPITSAVIWARDTAKAEAAAKELSADLGIPVTASSDLAGAVSGADVIVTTTPAAEPLIKADWLRPGQHVTAMGSDQHHKAELEPACLTLADLYVPDRQSQTALMGELRGAIEAGLVPPDRTFTELGDIVAGKAPGRTSPDQITIADLTGTGVQDTAIATFARQRADAAGIGTDFNS
ncbi:ectoine utilization protein EutC [Defluviimonas sp. WL0050]|uniref:Ectoine utilization protein EutC n=1 Tax=Albidovulum litorale TaxID=2984134 RepID=A0ABT2ZRZ7_9RHOB|nr:ectoine utilization protein EutC [Defluviimonas sp. WL0050]MCV2873930.1 ectoine utilization protein EutC [Defluviimonas sp. WL0050]